MLLEVKNLTFRYDARKTDGITDISFILNKNETLSLIGPSGAGKSTLLRCLKEHPQNMTSAEELNISLISGEMKLNEEQTVFQLLHQAQVKEVRDDQKENQIRTVLTSLELTNEIESPIKNLSSGQKQRLIIANALITNPNLILMDEPFSHLDNNLREILLDELRALFKEKEISTIWVTHNTKEALKYSDQILLMNFGIIEQLGAPKELFFKPKNSFVAGFLGENNIFPVRKLEKESNRFQVLSHKIELPFTASDLPAYEDFLIALRPQFIKPDANGDFSGKIQNIYFQGESFLFKIKCNDQIINMITTNYSDWKVGDQIKFNILWNQLTILN